MAFENLSEVAEWVAAHTGRTEAWWVTQKETEDDHGKRILALETRQHSIKLHLGIIIGVCSILGPLVGTYIVTLM